MTRSGIKPTVLDTSAAVALIVGEPQSMEIVERLEGEGPFYIAGPTVVELSLVLAGRFGRDAEADVARLKVEASLIVLPFTDVHASAAFDAWKRYGRGRHPAGLNLGDCISYAAAKVARAELLYVGNDFAQTDLA